jgi:N,N'-diacetyllegionaminate synthase
MDTIRSKFNVSIGYSDHTKGIEASIAAVALGATIIEKHFTLNKELQGPDHKASIDPSELSAMVKAVRNIELAMGLATKEPTKSEIKNKLVVRKSIIANQAIKFGEVFNTNNLTVKRPGNGISPMKWNEIIGHKASRDFDKDELIEL